MLLNSEFTSGIAGNGSRINEVATKNVKNLEYFTDFKNKQKL